MYIKRVYLCLSLAVLSSAEPVQRRDTPVTIFPPVSGTPTITSACASVSSMSAKQIAASPSARVSVPPSLALECLKSVPVDTANDVALIDYALPFFTFHSTLEYLKNPPAGYLLPGVDVIGGLEAIRQKLRDGGYSNQYEFTQEFNGIILAANDGHLSLPLQLNSIFRFTGSIDLVSLSKDGLTVPAIYLYGDIGQDYTPSNIVAINGIDIQAWITEFGKTTKQQDPDAAFNAAIRPLFRTAGDAFRFAAPSLPDTYNVTLGDGRQVAFKNSAILQVPFKGINSGEDLHSRYGIPTSTTSASASGSTATAAERRAVSTGIAGYPSPVVINQNQYISGYFLDSADNDTCVLVLNSFAPSDESGMTDGGEAEMKEAQQLFSSFFQACKSQGRDKLIVDLQLNPGGIVFTGLELYRQLFPKGDTWFATRLRVHAAMNATGQALYKPNDSTELGMGLFADAIKTDGTDFADWADMYSPVPVAGEWQSNLLGFNYSNPQLATGEPGTAFLLTGANSSASLPSQPFDAENIIVLTDGHCASTCTVFTGLMTREAGVRTVALGGRPIAAPMQAMGGVKGGMVLPFAAFQQAAAALSKSNSLSADLAKVYPSTGDAPLQLSGHGSVNYWNAYPDSSTDNPPLQFVYEAANCKRFHKEEYFLDITSAWSDVAEVAWGTGQCVEGSTSNSDGTIGDKAPSYSDAVRSNLVYNGPGSLTNDDWKSLLSNTSGTDASLDQITNSTTNGTGSGGGDQNGAGVAVPAVWWTAFMILATLLSL